MQGKTDSTLWTDDFRNSEERSCYIRNMTIKNNLHLCTHLFMYILMHIYRVVHTCVGQTESHKLR